MNIIKPLAQLSTFACLWMFILSDGTDYRILLFTVIFMLVSALSPAYSQPKRHTINFNLEFYVSQPEDVAEVEEKVKNAIQTLLSPETRPDRAD